MPELKESGLDNYESMQEIAQGGMGIVYRAEQVEPRRTVAIKMMRKGEFASELELRRFRVEAELASTLDHANIVPIYEMGEHQGQPYFTMPLFQEGSLAEHFEEYSLAPPAGKGQEPPSSGTRRESAIPPREKARKIARLLRTVARAVHYAHQRGILHRDLKPSNIMLDREGEPHVADFGLGRRIEKGNTLTHEGTILGTPSYMSPERAGAQESYVATDVYSLGAILYHLLVGHPPFRSSSHLDTIIQVREKEVVPPSRLNPRVDRDMEVICLKCLEKDPSRRYGSAAELADELDRWLNGTPIKARAHTARERLWRWAQRNPSLAVAASALSVLFLVTLILLGFLFDKNRRTDRTQTTWEMKVERDLEKLWKDPNKTFTIIDSETRALIGGLTLHPVPPAQSVRLAFAVYTHQTPKVMREKFTHVLAYLEKTMSQILARTVRIDLHIYKGYDNSIAAMAEGKVDFGRLGAVSYVHLKKQQPGIQLLFRQNDENIGYIFTSQNRTHINQLADLAGKRFAFGDRKSTLSSQLPKVHLVDAGITSEVLASYRYLGSHSAAIDAVMKGEFDAGAANANALTNQMRALERPSQVKVLRKMVGASMAWVAREGLPPAHLEALRESMFNMEPALLNQITKNLSGFTLATDLYYDKTRRMIDKAKEFDAQ